MVQNWYQHFLDHGYAVVPSVIPTARAKEYQDLAFDWLQSFDNPALDLSEPTTWTPSNLPYISEINTFNHYGVVHEKFMWDIRQEQGVIDAFSKIWNTDKLLVSFDALNITLPRRQGHTPRSKWPHVDQSPYRKGLQCVQGIVNLSSAGPEDGGLTIYPSSHKVIEDYFQKHTNKSQWNHKDFYRFTESELDWFTSQGFKERKVNAKPGDLILWDSRLVHFGAEPTEKSSTIRTVVYVSYAPVSFASQAVLDVKKKAFDQWSATTHWPHDNITLRSNEPLFADGTVDKRRKEPRVKPELTPKLLMLAGMVPYD